MAPQTGAANNPDVVTFLSTLQAMMALLFLAPAVVFVYVGSQSRGDFEMTLGGIAAFLVVGHLATAVGLRRRQSWALPAAALLALVACPGATILSLFVLHYARKAETAALFTGRSLEAPDPKDAAALDASVSSAVKGVAMFVLFVSVPAVGFFAMIQAALFTKGRVMAHEARTIAVLRTIERAEDAYKGATPAGLYGTLECLAAPSSSGCLSLYSGPPFADADLAAAEDHGYRRFFTLSPDKRGYTFSAVPLGPYSGFRSFCIDEAGICFTEVSVSPLNDQGRCDRGRSCRLLQ